MTEENPMFVVTSDRAVMEAEGMEFIVPGNNLNIKNVG